MELNRDKIEELVAAKLAEDLDDKYEFENRVEAAVKKAVERRVNEAFEKIGNTLIEEALANAMTNWRGFKLSRTNSWGDPTGEPITLPQWIEEQITKTRGYGNEKELASKLKDEITKIAKGHAEKLVQGSSDAIAAAVNDGLKLAGINFSVKPK